MHLEDDKESKIEIMKKKNGKKLREVNKRGVFGRDMLKLTQRISCQPIHISNLIQVFIRSLKKCLVAEFILHLK